MWIAAVALLAAAGISFPFLGRMGPGIRFGVPGTLTAAALVLAAFALGNDAPGDPLAGLDRAPFPDPQAPDTQSQGADLIEQGRAAANAGRDDDARELFGRAMDFFQAADFPGGMGEVKLQTGILDQIVGQGERAREVFSEANAFFTAAADPMGQGRVALALGDLEKAQFNNNAALAAFSNAQTLFHEQGDWTREAEALLGRAHAERRLHLVLASRRSVARASAIYDLLQDTKGLRNAAQSLEELKTYQDRNDLMDEELAVELINTQMAEDPSSEADVMVRIGDLHFRGGHPETARTSYVLAAALWAGEGRVEGQARALTKLGDLERALERTEEARTAYAQALRFYRDTGDDLGAAQVLAGQAALEVERDQDSQHLYAQARALFEAAGQPDAIGNILLGLGNVDRRLGRVDEARSDFEAAQEMFGGQGDTLGEAQALLALGDLAKNLGEIDTAVSAYGQALVLFHQSLYRIGEAWVHFGLGETLAAREPREASVNYRMGAEIFRDVRMGARMTAATAAAAALD